MLERLLLGILSLGLPDQSPTEDDAVLTPKVTPVVVKFTSLQDAVKLHLGMLSISLITGLAFGGYMGYSCWAEKNNFRAYVRNMVIAFVCRIFFSILFDGVVILGSNASAGGANALLALECLSQNFVIAYWLLLTIYLHARMQSHFNSEPTLTLYEYSIPGVAAFFAFVWIFGLQSEFPSFHWWLVLSYLPQWIVGSIRLLYLLIQLGLVVDMGRMMMKTSLDNDSVSLLRKSAAVLAALILLFWLQFGLSLGRLPPLKSQSYHYFDFFIDGSQGGLVCLILFFFDLWVPKFLNKMPSIMMESEEAPKRTQEILVSDGRGINTIDKVFTTKDNGRWKTISEADAVEFRDVMYSTVVEPHRLKKTLDLYRRLNVLPSSQATVLDGEKFYDCETRRSIKSEGGDSEKVEFRSVISDGSRSTTRENSRRTPKLTEQVQKKNAFYASKYLILDSKESDFPKFLETRPSAAKKSAKEGPERDFFSNLDPIIPDELVNKWLNDSMDIRRKSIQEEHGKELSVESEGKLAKSGKDLNENSDQSSAQQSNANSLEETGSTVRALESINENKEVVEHLEKNYIKSTLPLMEAEPPPVILPPFQQTNKRKHSETDKSVLPNDLKKLGSDSGQVDLESGNLLAEREPSEVHRQSKRRKSAEEYLPKPPPRKPKDAVIPREIIEPPQQKIQDTESNLTSTPNSMETPLTGRPYLESPSTAQPGGFSDVIYTTFNSLLSLRDGLYKPSTFSDEEISARDPKSTQKIPTNAQSQNADYPFTPQSKGEKVVKERTPIPIVGEQTLEKFAQEKVEGREKPPLERIQKPQKSQLRAPSSPRAETAEDNFSSDSNFSIERTDSSFPIFSVDDYYAGLTANRAKFGGI